MSSSLVSQEKLNEAVVLLNKSLQVMHLVFRFLAEANRCVGDQRSEHERGARLTDVQELPVQRSLPP